MLWTKLAHKLLASNRLAGPERDTADVLHLVIRRHGQHLSDCTVGGVLAGTQRRTRAMKSQQQYRLAQFVLLLLRQFLIAAILFHHC